MPYLAPALLYFFFATVLVHGNKVQGTVEPASQITVIDGVSELLVLEVEHFVFVLAIHQIHAGTNVLGVRTLGDETKLEIVTGGFDAVSVSVLRISTLNLAIRSAGFGIRAEAFIPQIPRVAVGRLTIFVGPSPIAVNGDSAVDSLAPRGCALLIVQLGLVLLRQSAGLLRGGSGNASCNN